MDTDLWRTQLPSNARERIVNKIMETLKRSVPYSGQEGLEELRKIALRFEEKIYACAVSQSDYLRKLSMKMLTMESKSQNTILNSLPPNPSGNNNRPPDAGVSIWRSAAAQGAEPSAKTGGDWKTQLPPDSRQRNVNDIMAMLKRNLPYSGEEGLAELMRIAVRFEEKVYADAMSQIDYMLKIRTKMFELGSRPLNTNPNPLSPNPSGSNNNRPPNVGVSVLRPNAAEGARARLLQQRMQQQQRLQMTTHQNNTQNLLQRQQQLQLQQQQQQQQQQQLHQQLQQQQQQQGQLHQLLQQGQLHEQLRAMQQPQQVQQQPQQLQHLMALQDNLSRMHEQQLGSQSNVSGLLQQQQLLGTQPGNSTVQNNQPSLHMLQRPNVPLQQQQQTVQNSLLELGCI